MIKKFFVSDLMIFIWPPLLVLDTTWMTLAFDANILGTDILDLLRSLTLGSYSQARVRFTVEILMFLGLRMMMLLGSTSVDRWSYSSSKAVVEHMLLAFTVPVV